MRAWVIVALTLCATVQPVVAQAGSGGQTQLPLREHSGRLIVPVTGADGTEWDFILSTGTGVTVVSESAVAAMGSLEGLSLGGHPIDSRGAQTLPDEDLTADGVVFAGMVGPSTLNQFDILIDLPRERLILQPVGPMVSWEGVSLSDPVRLRVLHGIILSLDVELNGTTYPAMLDLGTPTLLVNEGVQRDGNLRTDGSNVLTLGSRTFTGLPGEFRALPVFERFSPTGAGFVLVGNPMTWECALSISWVHRELRTCAP
jgi:hypothetical protein